MRYGLGKTEASGTGFGLMKHGAFISLAITSTALQASLVHTHLGIEAIAAGLIQANKIMPMFPSRSRNVMGQWIWDSICILRARYNIHRTWHVVWSFEVVRADPLKRRTILYFAWRTLGYGRSEQVPDWGTSTGTEIDRHRKLPLPCLAQVLLSRASFTNTISKPA